MTNEEKQEIIAAVLAALRTNSKTIGQLTPVTSLSDDDKIEISGGKNIKYSKLLDLLQAVFQALLGDYVQADVLASYIETYIAKLGDNGALKWQESPIVFLASMGSDFDDVDGALNVPYTIQEGDLFYWNENGYQIHEQVSSSSAQGYLAKTGVIYINLQTMRLYKWSGTAMLEVKKRKTRVVLKDLHTQDYTSLTDGDIAYDPIEKKIVERFATTWRLSDPDPDIIYSDAQNDKTIRWDATEEAWVEVGGNTPIVNDLTTGGEDAALSAEQGLILRREITSVHTSLSRLYSKLANMAFWDSQDQSDAEPTPLNFNVPQKTLTFNLTGVGSNVIVKLDNAAFTSPVSVDAGSTHTITIQAAEDFVLNNDVAVTVNGSSKTLTESGGVYSLQITANNDKTIVVVGTATQEWFTVPKSDVTEGGNVTLYGAQQGRSIVTTGGYMTAGIDTNNIPQVTAAPAGYKESVKLYTTPYVEGSYNNSNPGKTTANYFATGGKRYLNIQLIDPAEASGDTYHIGAGCYGSGVIGNSAANAGGVSTIAGFKARIGYKTPDSTTADGVHVWKIDLPTESSSTGIEYVKLIMLKKVNGTTTDSRNWFANATIKYKFSDD